MFVSRFRTCGRDLLRKKRRTDPPSVFQNLGARNLILGENANPAAWSAISGSTTMSAQCPLRPTLRTQVGHLPRSEKCRLCSLIPSFGVKLSAIILAGPTVLSAVGPALRMMA